VSTTSGGGRARVSGGVVRALASYLRRAAGADVLAWLLQETGIEVDPDDQSLDTTWFESRRVAQLVDRAEAALGDPELGRRTGEEMFRFRPDLHSLYHSAGSVAEAVKVAVNLGSRTRTEPAFVVVDEGPNHLVVHATAPRASPFSCGVSAGHWSQLPTLFSTVGAAIKTACVARGDARCEFRIAWDPVPATDDSALERSRERSDALVWRFEELLGLAAELTAEATTDGLLQKIAERASSAVMAPAAVVSVRFAEDDDLHLGWSGLTEVQALELAHAAARGPADLGDSFAVVDIASARRSYGQVIVAAQPGAAITANEHRMLRAYAGHATAAIEAAAALEAAKVERDTAESLLGLARALASLGDTGEIAQRIAEEVTTVVKCDIAAMMLWDPAAGRLSFAGFWPGAVDTLGFEAVSIDEVPLARRIVHDAVPAFIHTAETDGLLHTLLRAAEVIGVSAAPIVIRGEVAGIILAGCRSEHGALDTSTVLRRLSGLADHAASALDNSRLLERVQHQALHDPLTGLSNRTLIEDRVEHALAMAERADRWVSLLFVDLDRFKEVNDQLGHAAGDALLRQLAVRLESCVRASDTVGRLGGDEFLILLENTSGDEDGARVAEKVIDVLREPFHVGGRLATVSVSIGITSAPGRGTSYAELLARADDAMYEVKRRGRDGWSVYRPG
jgi:diguanylate cyclase (GGDEF)-like protein